MSSVYTPTTLGTPIVDEESLLAHEPVSPESLIDGFVGPYGYVNHESVSPESLIDGFVSLPRPIWDPCGYVNHWHISLQPVPHKELRCEVVLTKPAKGLAHRAGMIDLEPPCRKGLRIPDLGRKCLLMALGAFLRPDVACMRPFTWHTDSPVTLVLVMDAVMELGLADAVPPMGIACPLENAAVDQIWKCQFRELESGSN